MIAEGLTNENAIREGIRKDAAEEGKTLTREEEAQRYQAVVQRISDIRAHLRCHPLGLGLGIDVGSVVTGATIAVENDYAPQTWIG